jgi:hypothetical protein
VVLQQPTPVVTGASNANIGVNLSGGEFGSILPGTYAVDYIYPTDAELAYYQSKGMKLIRMGFRWERVQRTLSSALDATELGRIDTFVAFAAARGMKVILEPLNTGRYVGEQCGFAYRRSRIKIRVCSTAPDIKISYKLLPARLGLASRCHWRP